MKRKTFTALLVLLTINISAQNGLVNTSQSPYAKLNSVGMSDVQWTKGFWAERFDVCKNTMVPTFDFVDIGCDDLGVSLVSTTTKKAT